MKEKIKPFGLRILIKFLDEEKQTKTGIILPHTEKERDKGIIVALGKSVSSELKVGDKVFFSKIYGQEIKDDDKEYVIIEADKVLAILE